MSTPSANDPTAGAPTHQPRPTDDPEPIRHGVGRALRIRTTHLYRLSGCFSVLDTPELLEMIIRELDISTIMRLYRTSKECRAFIESSLPIKKKLWLVPDDDNNDTGSTSELAGLNPFMFDIRTRGSTFFSPKPCFKLVKPLPPTDLRAHMIVAQCAKPGVRVCVRVYEYDRWMGLTVILEEMEKNSKYEDVVQYVAETRDKLPGRGLTYTADIVVYDE